MSKPRLRTLQPRVQPLRATLPSSNEDRRIRGTTLQNIRRAHFSERPLCVRCQAKTPPVVRIATELDHVIPLHLGGIESRDPFVNRAGLCADCHAEKSREEQAGRESRLKAAGIELIRRFIGESTLV